MTSMMLASAYLGGVYFFTRVALRERRWHAVRTGFVAVALFATLLGVATLLHWTCSAMTSWRSGYGRGFISATPFLVAGGWLANQRHGRAAGTRERLIGPGGPRIGAVGLLALVQGLRCSWRRRR